LRQRHRSQPPLRLGFPPAARRVTADSLAVCLAARHRRGAAEAARWRRSRPSWLAAGSQPVLTPGLNLRSSGRLQPPKCLAIVWFLSKEPGQALGTGHSATAVQGACRWRILALLDGEWRQRGSWVRAEAAEAQGASGWDCPGFQARVSPMNQERRLSSRDGDCHPGPQRADLEIGGTPGSWAESL